jgi:hypothetical protein
LGSGCRRIDAALYLVPVVRVPLSAGPFQPAPGGTKVFYPRRGTPPSSDPPRPTLRRDRVTGGDGREYGGRFKGGDKICWEAEIGPRRTVRYWCPGERRTYNRLLWNREAITDHHRDDRHFHQSDRHLRPPFEFGDLRCCLATIKFPAHKCECNVLTLARQPQGSPA